MARTRNICTARSPMQIGEHGVNHLQDLLNSGRFKINLISAHLSTTFQFFPRLKLELATLRYRERPGQGTGIASVKYSCSVQPKRLFRLGYVETPSALGICTIFELMSGPQYEFC
jgi:hypothetical protein